MRNSWYPALLVEQLDATEPYGIQILGYPLCFWRHKGKVQCVMDACPHRSAPLSVGRVVDGVLECKYHGWQFGPAGHCDFIPSAPEQKLGPSYHAKALPTKEIYDAVWVWIGEELPEEELEKRFPYQIFHLAGDSNWCYNFGERDLNIDHGLMIENLLDPAHLPFTHEGTLAKRTDAQLMTMKTVWNTATARMEPSEPDKHFDWVEATETKGFRVEAFRPNSKTKPYAGSFTFVAPCLTVLDITINEKKNTKLIQVNWSVPVTPTKMRFIYWFFRNAVVSINRIPGFNRAFRWSSDKIIDQDVAMLGGQQVRLDQGARPWNSAVSADTGGVLYRKWRQKEERQKPWFASFAQNADNIGDIEEVYKGCAVQFSEVPSSQFRERERLPLFPPKVFRAMVIAFAAFLLSILYYFY
eukprot:CAMPEP_0206188882 /NCGR_PEP_ID=MMETSP0166-20121206/3850_1 /ASSEMBLY_ACC=CAM_ASM_000260 /TAXON_ID=95228 /ORGANISM="Vannella robusta, Strain DIVA3 518/3/11/1/6" /LENGTH=411 /DNA_ID=CAMNT_0053604717 /DNA_START=112 /DNA_END=1347 /DNA_ORIENTATION=+